MKRPEYLKRIIRQNLDLEPDDKSQDDKIEQMSNDELFNRRLEWEGIVNWGSTIKRYVEDIYGVDLDNRSFYTEQEMEMMAN